jgi:hypothetical protein
MAPLSERAAWGRAMREIRPGALGKRSHTERHVDAPYFVDEIAKI